MSGYQKKEGDIAVFYNNPAEKKNPKSPDWTGEALINGEVMRVAFWGKSPTMLAGSIQKKDTSYSGGSNPANPSSGYGGSTDMDNDIPFD